MNLYRVTKLFIRKEVPLMSEDQSTYGVPTGR